jgi:hypothetical protein
VGCSRLQQTSVGLSMWQLWVLLDLAVQPVILLTSDIHMRSSTQQY